MAALEVKQNELDALQKEFDEYIESSKEMEEELDAELTKCQNDLTKSESRNIALANQLASIQPQLNSLQKKLSSLTAQLSSETQRRISAEMKCEEAENKLRESEGTLAAVRSSEVRKWKEENEELCERLAFVEGEAEDYRDELNTARQRHRDEMEEMKADMDVLRTKVKERDEELELIKANTLNENGKEVGDGTSGEEMMANAVVSQGPSTPSTNVEQEEYTKSLENELEIVTEQLIQAETKLTQTQAELEEALAETETVSKSLAEVEMRLAKTQAELDEAIVGTENANKALKEANSDLSKTQADLEDALKEAALANSSHATKHATISNASLEHLQEENTVLHNKLKLLLSDQADKAVENDDNDDSSKAIVDEANIGRNNQHSERIEDLESSLQLLQEEYSALLEESKIMNNKHSETIAGLKSSISNLEEENAALQQQASKGDQCCIIS